MQADETDEVGKAEGFQPELEESDTTSKQENSDVDPVFEAIGGEEPGEPDPEDRLAAAEREVLVVRAEMENFRKRMKRESEQLMKYANMNLMRDLLDVVDNLNRASGAAAGDAESNLQALVDGVAMVSQQLADVLGKHGCHAVEALGKPFDPNFHEAISQLPSDEYPSGTVMNEVGVGYVLHDRVVRPSHVVVSKGSDAE